jgi:hypothetical protein
METYFEIQTSATDHTVDFLESINGLDIGQHCIQSFLGVGQGFLVVVGRPLASPFSSHRIKLDALGNGSHGTVQEQYQIF